MTLNQLQNEMIAAMKSGDKFRKSVISTAIARIKNTAIDKGCRDDVPESIVDAELLKAKKITEEMIATCPESRTDLLEDYKKQLEIICEFAPNLIADKTKIREMILDVVNNEYELTKANKGKIMKIVMPVLRGKVDMGVANKIIGEMLV